MTDLTAADLAHFDNLARGGNAYLLADDDLAALVAAVRALAREILRAVDAEGRCIYCAAWVEMQPHAPDCIVHMARGLAQNPHQD